MSGETSTSRPAGKAGRPTGPNRRRAERAVAAAGQTGGIGRGTIIGGTLIAVFAVVVLFFVYQSSQSQPDPAASGSASGYKHVAGEPGIGEKAPGFTLPSSTGGEISLADFRGESVLLYFQEGLMCQPCIDQITDLEANQADLDKAGIDRVLSISHDPIDQVTQKASDENLSTPWLSDPQQQVIHAYDAHKYGMMQGQTAGHSFILVSPDGTIQWRADYGGAPDYTMFVPTGKMLADLAKERA
ncbi:MAG: redoxin domain-containing protein [Actinophytocola sp.]|nr:redoxin domain-containing protein [Actinophytocola sp.]